MSPNLFTYSASNFTPTTVVNTRLRGEITGAINTGRKKNGNIAALKTLSSDAKRQLQPPGYLPRPPESISSVRVPEDEDLSPVRLPKDEEAVGSWARRNKDMVMYTLGNKKTEKLVDKVTSTRHCFLTTNEMEKEILRMYGNFGLMKLN